MLNHWLKKLIFNFIFCIFFFLSVVNASDGSDGDDEDDEDDYNDNTLKHRAAILIMLTLLIVVSLSFEFFRYVSQKNCSQHFSPLFDAMWAELSNCGVISLVTFALSKSKFLENISEEYFEEKIWLTEQLEIIHVLLFIVFVVYVMEVFLIMHAATRASNKWHDTETFVTANPKVVIEDYERLCSLKLSAPLSSNDSELWADRKYQMEYLCLRWRFINVPMRIGSPILDENFQFYSYLNVKLRELCIEIVELHPMTWFGLEMLFLAFFGFTYYGATVRLCMFAVLALGLPCVAFLMMKKLVDIQAHLLIQIDSKPALPMEEICDSEKEQEHILDDRLQIQTAGLSLRQPLLDLVDSSAASSDEKRSETRTPAVLANNQCTDKSMHEDFNEKEPRTILPELTSYVAKTPSYLQRATVQRWKCFGFHIGEYFLGPIANQHELLFFPQSAWTPKFIQIILSWLMLMNATYFATLTYLITPMMIREPKASIDLVGLGLPDVAGIFLCLGYLLPMVLTVWNVLPAVMAEFTICTGIEMMRDEHVVHHCCELQREKEARDRVALLTRVLQIRRIQREAAGTPARDIVLTSEHILALKHTFSLYASPITNDVCIGDLKALLASCGTVLTDDETVLAMMQADTSGDGALDENEFIQFINDLQCDMEKKEPTLDDVIDLFRYLDTDNSGTITVQELTVGLKKLLQRPSVDENELSLEQQRKEKHEALSIMRLVKKSGEYLTIEDLTSILIPSYKGKKKGQVGHSTGRPEKG